MNSTVRTTRTSQNPHFKSILDSHREEALKSLRQSEAEKCALDSDRPTELGDVCTESAGREDLFERISHHRRLLQRIEAALRRIDYGTFGECTCCGDEISYKRLQIMPWTEFCVRCQEDFERATVSRSTWSTLRRMQKRA
jgi:DnaK suppressor protein